MKCFKDHESDNQELYKVNKCEVLYTENDGKGIAYGIQVSTCESVWREYQDEAYEIIAPGGRLIRDPQERNRAINAAYARLWLHDNRFQWAGLAAFASKQVGCGLLHASDIVMKMQAEDEAAQRMLNSTKRVDAFGISLSYTDDEALREYQEAASQNPMLTKDVSHSWSLGMSAAEISKQVAREGAHKTQSELYKQMQRGFRYVHDKLMLGNTVLFLDVYPLHAFYAKRGLKELKMCVPLRNKLTFPRNKDIYWPISEGVLIFGWNFSEIIQAFEAVEKGDVQESVRLLAYHEQVNVLQRIIYSDEKFALLLRGNQISFVTSLPDGVAQPVELTLAGQCRGLSDERTIKLDGGPFADLADVDQRMEFVYRAADQFHDLLNGPTRKALEDAIKVIAGGKGVQ